MPQVGWEAWTLPQPHRRRVAWLVARLRVRRGSRGARGPRRSRRPGSHTEGVFLAAILAGEAGGQPVSASATLAWRRPDLGGDRLDLEGLRQVYLRAPESPGEDRRARRVELVDLPSGGAVKVASKETAPVPTLAKVRSVAVTQYLVPVPHDGRLAVITATTGVPARRQASKRPPTPWRPA